MMKRADKSSYRVTPYVNYAIGKTLDRPSLYP